MSLVIGIPQVGYSLLQRYLKSKYVSSLVRAGAQVRWIEVEDADAAVKAAMECDGLLLAGGADVNPQLYGQESKPECGKPNDLRDRAEMKILDAFLPTNKPILCICRGQQLLNVYFGGTLHQDISKIQVCKHSRLRKIHRKVHQIKTFPRTKLQKILGSELLQVNSAHHQAVDQLGPGLTVNAVSEDGFIEGVEVFLHPFCVGVQWHPEHLSKNDPIQQGIFDAFIAACK